MTARVEEARGTGLFRVLDDAGPVEEINAFLHAVTTRGLSPLTVRAYAFDLAAAYRWMAAAGRTLSELTRADLHGFVAHERARGAKPASINRRLVALRLLHRFWYPHGMSTVAGTSLPSPHYRGRGRDRRLGLHVLKRLPDLARVSVSPWADEAFMARELGRDIVYSRKPKPTLISTEKFDEDAIRADLRHTLAVAQDCRVEIIMKDVHTLRNEPERLPRWVQIARETIDEMA